MTTKEDETFELVIADSMDLDLGQISVASPLGSSLINKKVGQRAEARLPMGTRKFKILELQTLHDLAGDELR